MIYLSKIIYLDNAATTRPSSEALAAASLAAETYFNPSSLHTGGTRADALVFNARRQVSSALGASPDEVFFTSGGTESDNTVIFSAQKRRAKHIIVSATEHDAILAPCKALEAAGIDVTYLAPDADGRFTARMAEDALRPDTALISMMLVNNETGIVNTRPIADISAMLRRKKSRALLHTDAVQGFLRIPQIKALGVDLASISGHKIYGLKGAGALFVRNGVHIAPMLLGGGQERGFRSGTESVPSISALGAACACWRPEWNDAVKTLKAYAVTRLSAEDGVIVPGFAVGEASGDYILGICVPGYKSEVLLHFLAEKDIYVSSGSACAKGRGSHVLRAMGLANATIDSFLRISFSHENTPGDIDALCDALHAARAEIRRA